MSEKRYPSSDPSTPRWWPAAALIVLLACARLAWLVSRADDSLDRQSVVMSAGATILLAGVALVSWLAFFSGLSRQARRWIFGVLAAGTGVFCLKEECVWQHNFSSFREARRVIRSWIRWYNEERPARTLI